MSSNPANFTPMNTESAQQQVIDGLNLMLEDRELGTSVLNVMLAIRTLRNKLDAPDSLQSTSNRAFSVAAKAMNVFIYDMGKKLNNE